MIIVDVGASGGIHPRWADSTTDFTAVLFEPDPRAYEKLKATMNDNYVILNAALSDKVGEVKLHLCKFQGATSIYEPDLEILSRYYDSTEITNFDLEDLLTIATDTLDNQLRAANLSDVDFIKVDVQGHELPVLQGGISTLKRVVGVEVEVEFLPIYKNQPLFADVDQFLRVQEFELFDIRRTFRNRRNMKRFGDHKGQLLWGDALYFKSPETILAMPDITDEKVIQAAQVFLAYNYPGLAKTLVNLAMAKGILAKSVKTKLAGLIAKYEVKKLNALPQFRGKYTLHRIFVTLASVFAKKRRTDRHIDSWLGNKDTAS